MILDRAIGWAQGGGPDDPAAAAKRLCTPDTSFVLFSASKAVTAMLVHLLDKKNLIRLDDPVCDYIPEFGVHGKQWITIRHLLTHRAGIPNLPSAAMRPDVLADIADPRRALELVCEARPVWRPGRVLAYHAVSGGFVLGEVIRPVTGRAAREFLDATVCRPLGFRYMRYGLAPDDHVAPAPKRECGDRQHDPDARRDALDSRREGPTRPHQVPGSSGEDDDERTERKGGSHGRPPSAGSGGRS